MNMKQKKTIKNQKHQLKILEMKESIFSIDLYQSLTNSNYGSSCGSSCGGGGSCGKCRTNN